MAEDDEYTDESDDDVKEPKKEEVPPPPPVVDMKQIQLNNEYLEQQEYNEWKNTISSLPDVVNGKNIKQGTIGEWEDVKPDEVYNDYYKPVEEDYTNSNNGVYYNEDMSDESEDSNDNNEDNQDTNIDPDIKKEFEDTDIKKKSLRMMTIKLIKIIITYPMYLILIPTIKWTKKETEKKIKYEAAYKDENSESGEHDEIDFRGKKEKIIDNSSLFTNEEQPDLNFVSKKKKKHK